MNIVFDLDGTLIDSKRRLYSLFQRLAPCSELSYDQYWTLKKGKNSNEMILASRLGYDRDSIQLFVERWMELIESPPLLELDGNFPGMHDSLSRLREKAILHVCTARQHHAPVLTQLDRLDLLPFFSKIIVTGQTRSKESLIGTGIPGLGVGDWMLGDTGNDIRVGKALNLKTCAVLSGFMDRENLLAYCPDIVLDSAVDFSL